MSIDASSDGLPSSGRIFYLHIPKTGGQTLATRLAGAFPIGRSDIINGVLEHPQGGDELRRLFASNDFVERHIAGPVLKDFRGADILTTIREPVAQIVSSYLHVRRAPENWLHRAVTALSPRDFFLQFGDFLANIQSRYLADAFFEQQVDPNPLRTLSGRSLAVVDRIRWVVTTESIDDFVRWWSIETGRSIRNVEANVNVARRGEQYDRLVDIVRGMPSLYCADSVLWQVARARYAEYREKVVHSIVGLRPQNDTARAFWDDGRGIWLREGWYPPQLGTPVGTAWWAGPGQYSEVAFLRAPADRYVRFSVAVVHGVNLNEIIAVRADKFTRLPMLVRESADRREYWVDLEDLPWTGNFWLWVPRVWSAIIVGGADDDTDRKSFATCDWSYAVELPAADTLVRLHPCDDDNACG